MHKPSLLLAGCMLLANTASAAYVDLATPSHSAEDIAFSITDSAVPSGWSIPSRSFDLTDASYMSASLQRTDWMMQVSLGLHDKESAINLAAGPVGPDFAFQQLSLTFLNFTGTDQIFAAGTLAITIGNLHSAEAAQITGFTFTGPDAATNDSAWDIFYSSSGGGTLTFSNTSAISVSSSNLWLFGQFTATAIPEPASIAALAGLSAVGIVSARRRLRPMPLARHVGE